MQTRTCSLGFSTAYRSQHSTPKHILNVSSYVILSFSLLPVGFLLPLARTSMLAAPPAPKGKIRFLTWSRISTIDVKVGRRPALHPGLDPWSEDLDGSRVGGLGGEHPERRIRHCNSSVGHLRPRIQKC